MSQLIETSDPRFQEQVGTFIRDTREALNLIEQVSKNAVRFKRTDFVDELRKVREHASWAISFATRDAVARVVTP